MSVIFFRGPLLRPIVRGRGHLIRRQYSSSLAQIGPLPQYFQLVSEKQLRPDEDQMRAVVKLQRLCETLLDYQPPTRAIHFEGFDQPPSKPGEELRVGNTRTKDLVHVDLGDESSIPKGVWIHGEVGTGKSMAMNLFYESMPLQKKKRVHFNAFTVSIFRRIHKWNNRTRPHHLHVTELVAHEMFHEAWLLCIDEFQITDVATATVIRQVLQHMFRMGAVMVATSNRSPDDLHKGGFHREHHSPFIDLINKRCDVVHLRGKTDYREQLLQQETAEKKFTDTYYRLDDPEQTEAFIERVARLFYGKRLRKDHFELYGRSVEITKAADGMALVTFDELCGSGPRPWGPADYLLLCQRYHTIVLQSVPVLGLVQKNEARRFITFIDAAYENKVKLIISAEAEPDDLFVTIDDPLKTPDESSDEFMHKEMLGDLMGLTRRGTNMSKQGKSFGELSKLAIFTGEDEKFAFRRAVSRLKEMRTSVWAGRSHVPQEVDVRRSKKDDDEAEDANTSKGNAGSAESPEPSWRAKPTPSSRSTSATPDQNKHYTPTDDFGDEASYSGYIRQYEKFNHLPHSSEQSKSAYERSQETAPRFRERHFWSMGEWGKRAGRWGMGVKAYLSDQGVPGKWEKGAKVTTEDGGKRTEVEEVQRIRRKGKDEI
ncbi:AFG1-like ATPase-domain-containing protein [Fimicolochytrium jonesii]|uniref:AFG1-like ATPase-domain-containing protein n=1 Tax=Fimicolochytrium jonesii TaxID=1396493 RepID=UPI0022FEC3B6|nr:AFG1-like ATPase-domain-containing protein [Fimicolochytrium jonesii]KAI8824947.1 AFG1-like ATPase-domain-containing protein [Fimicolochytrium jonesii]